MEKMQHLYFAYGSNMNIEQMNQRCPTAKKYANGIIQGWKMIINSKGVATIIRQNNSVVEGVIWIVFDADIKELDKREGISKNIYKKTYINVKNKHGVDVCIVYIATDQTLGMPRPGYIELIHTGAHDNNLYESYQKLI